MQFGRISNGKSYSFLFFKYILLEDVKKLDEECTQDALHGNRKNMNINEQLTLSRIGCRNERKTIMIIKSS